MDIVSAFPNTVVGWAELVAAVGLGVLVFAGFFDRIKKQREDDADKVDDRLIKLLKDQVEALEKKVKELDTQLAETKKDLSSLQGENNVLRNVLQGRDTSFQDYMKQGIITMGEVHQVLNLTRENGKNIERLYRAIEKHLGNLEKDG